MRKHALAAGTSDWDRHDHLSDVTIDCDQAIVIVGGGQRAGPELTCVFGGDFDVVVVVQKLVSYLDDKIKKLGYLSLDSATIDCCFTGCSQINGVGDHILHKLWTRYNWHLVAIAEIDGCTA